MVLLGGVAAAPPGTPVLRVQAGLIREGTAVTLAGASAAAPAGPPAATPAPNN